MTPARAREAVEVTNKQEEAMTSFVSELEQLLNRHCQENASNTPDFILAGYLFECLRAFNTAVQAREQWYGRDPKQGPGSGGTGPVPVDDK